MFGFLKKLIGGGADTEVLENAFKQNAYLVDVRTPAEFAGGSAKGAVNIPLGEINQQLGKFKGKKNIIVFCRSGNRSAQAKAILEKAGHTDVHNGGTWQNVQSIIEKTNQ